MELFQRSNTCNTYFCVHMFVYTAKQPWRTHCQISGSFRFFTDLIAAYIMYKTTHDYMYCTCSFLLHSFHTDTEFWTSKHTLKVLVEGGYFLHNQEQEVENLEKVEVRIQGNGFAVYVVLKLLICFVLHMSFIMYFCGIFHWFVQVLWPEVLRRVIEKGILMINANHFIRPN